MKDIVHKTWIREVNFLVWYTLARRSEMRIQVRLMTQQMELISCR